jgi:hypothetical protein
MAALADMQPRNRGTIIQIGSALAYRGIPLQTAYRGAKHGVRGFTDSLRCELINSGSAIRVTMVQLPAVNTPQFDWGRTYMSRQPRPVPPVIQPEVVAEAVFRAANHPAREYWIGWSALKVILGNMLLPDLVDWYLARSAIEGQQTRFPVSVSRKDNLLSPVPGLHGTRGRFGSEASNTAIVLPGTVGRLAPVIVGATACFALGALVHRAASRRASGRRSPRRQQVPALQRQPCDLVG